MEYKQGSNEAHCDAGSIRKLLGSHHFSFLWDLGGFFPYLAELVLVFHPALLYRFIVFRHFRR